MKSLLQLLLVIISILCTASAIAQQASDTTKKDTTGYLSRAGQNRLLNQRFGSIVTGQSNNTAIGNYASFDPADGSFAFKGAMGFGAVKDKTSRGDQFLRDSSSSVFLSISLQGDLLSQTYAALFSNTKLNTGGTADLQLHIRLDRENSITYFKTDYERLHLAEKVQTLKKDNQLALVAMENTQRDDEIKKRSLSKAEITMGLQYNQDSLTRLIAKADTAATYTVLKAINAQADTVRQSIDKLTQDRLRIQAELDSINYRLDPKGPTRQFFLERGAIETINHAQDSLFAQGEFTAPFYKMNILWLTLTAGGSKKSFYTYDATLAFDQQVSKEQLSTFRLGIALNYYWENGLTNHALLANIGVLRYKDNNTSLLSTQKLAEETASQNPAGNTTRKVSNTYNVYTDPIVESQLWDISSNCYFIRKGRKNALHVYPSFEVKDSGDNLANLGLGYIVSFKNTKTDQPIINAEGYVQFQDLFNHLNTKAGFYNRNEIGIRFTLPFSLF